MQTPDNKIVYSVQEILNMSFDEDARTLLFQQLGFDGSSFPRNNADNLATKITESGSITYIAFAAPGSSESSSVWQCKKIDETTGTVITYADGDADFDNSATDLTALTYS